MTHTRSVVCDGDDYRMSCECGYLSSTRLTARLALMLRCPVEEELLDSAFRRDQMAKRLIRKGNDGEAVTTR